MSRVCDLLDEDTPHALRNQLLRREPEMDVSAVGDAQAPDRGTDDATNLKWIEQHGYILVSRNRRSLPRHLRDHVEAGGHVPGIFLLRRRHTFGQVIEDLLLVWGACDAGEYRDRIEYLPL